MAPTAYPKRDLTVGYAGRTFAIRAYLDGAIAAGPQWRALIIEQRTPLPYAARLSPDPASCLADAVRHLIAAIAAPAAAEAECPHPDRMLQAAR
jgi:hypothetical protein